MVTMQACDVMRKVDELALVSAESTVRETIYAMSHARSGAAVIVDEQKKLLGIFTDGDFRRNAAADDLVLTRKVGDFMTVNPVSVKEDSPVVEVIKLVEKRHIDDLVVVNGNNQVVGLIDIQDLPGLKIM